MLNTRHIMNELAKTSLTIKVARVYPQWRVLSSLIWTLVITELLKQLNDLIFRPLGCADVLATVVVGWHEQNIIAQMRRDLHVIHELCQDERLHEGNKRFFVPFPRKRKPSLSNIFFKTV